MPEINKIPEVLHEANQPYHFHYDNLPLKNILKRIDLVNAQVDINSDILRGCSGSVGSLSNRLEVSLNDDGSLKTQSVDDANHNIATHTDGEKVVSEEELTNYIDLGFPELVNPISFVRMLDSERAKLKEIANGATNLKIELDDSLYEEESLGTVTLSEGSVRFESTDTMIVDFESPNIIKLHSVFPAEAAHKHHYNILPAHSNPSSPDYINFITSSINTPFMEGSLRVYINGIRINDLTEVLVPDANNTILIQSASTTNSSNVISGLITSNLEVGMVVSGAGIPSGSKISSIINGTSISINNAADSTTSNKLLTFQKLMPTIVASSSPESGAFVLNRSLSEDDLIYIDFDESFIS